MQKNLTTAPPWPPTWPEAARAVLTIFATAVVAAACTFLAPQLGAPILAPVAPLVLGLAWGHGYLGGWLLVPRRWW